ncbi:hypothetical protein ACQ4PT_046563 [Festuca glaucescens]
METKQVTWTPTMSAYMLTNLCDVVAKGTRTSTGFKKCHYVACAKALNDHFHLSLTDTQISNHNRTWRRKYQKIVKLKQLSGAGWDEEKFIIVLDHEHYTNHILDQKEDEPFLNKPIEHFEEMATIHGGSMATGQFARGSSEPLASNNVVHRDEEVAATPDEVGQSQNVGESSAPKPKKAKTNPSVDERLQATLLACSERLVVAIEKTASTNNNSPLELWENMKTLPGFGLDFLAHYYAYLVENPRIAMAFQVLENDQKMIWVARYVKNSFPDFVPSVDPSDGGAER